MAAAEYNFNIEQGSSYTTAFVYKDSNQNPINITNWCARMLMTTSDGQTIVYESSTVNSNYQMNIDGPNGTITLKISSQATNDFTFKTAKYDLELESPTEIYTGGGNYTTRVLYGTITILKRNSHNSTAMEC